MGKLIIARHHESEWNHTGQWTGQRDRHMTDYGFQKATEMGQLIKDIHIDNAFASMLVRTIETLSCMLESLNLSHVPTVHTAAFNERDYGDYTGKNKWDMQELVGVETWNKIRRDWEYPIPHGETLKMVSERVVSYFMKNVLPLLNDGRNVLIVAHGNSLRALIKYIEQISDEGIADVEMPFGAVVIYDLDQNGHLISKETRAVDSQVHA